MGLDIGFDIYKKEKSKDGKITLTKAEFPKDKEDDAWACGRCSVNYSWGYGSSWKENEIIKVTFDKELDGYKFPAEKDYTPVSLKYVPYGEFKSNVMDSVDEAIQDGFQEKRRMYKRLADNLKTIKELRECQKECKRENEFAFDKWTEEINQIKEDNEQLQEDMDNFDQDDYDTSHAIRLKKMLGYMEECAKDYVCIPWYSD